MQYQAHHQRVTLHLKNLQTFRQKAQYSLEQNLLHTHQTTQRLVCWVVLAERLAVAQQPHTHQTKKLQTIQM